MNKKEWKLFLEKEKQLLDISSIAVLDLSGKEIKNFSTKIAKRYKAAADYFLPEYILRTIDLRTDPCKLFPWAESLFIAAVPFNIIPVAEDFIPRSENPEITGKIADYATRKDYHIFAKELLAKFAEDLAKFAIMESGGTLKTKVCVDTMPIAERPLAALANIGVIGRNFSLLTYNAGSRCFIAELFSNLKIPDIKERSFRTTCESCSACLSACSTGAITRESTFAYNLCRSSITMEKRGVLNNKEREMLGDWIFGCDDCSSCCPGSKQPSSFHADLEWLLFSPLSEVKRKISGTPLEYAGVTLLRRNALAVLENKKSNTAIAMIKKFIENSKSVLLKATATDILESNKNKIN